MIVFKVSGYKQWEQLPHVVVGSKESRVFGSLDYRIFGINAVEEMALMNTEPVSKVDQIILRFKESLPVL